MQDMDNDATNMTYDEQPAVKVPALLKLLFPASARTLLAYDDACRQADGLQNELDQVLNELNASNVNGRATALKIIMAAKQAANRAADKREAKIFSELQAIDPELNSVDAVRRKLDACAFATAECVEVEPDDQIEISIDGFDTEKDAPADDAISEKSEEYMANIAALKAENQLAIDNLRTEYEAKIDDMQKRHAAELQQLISDYECRIEGMHLNMEHDLDRLNAAREADAMAWRAERADLEARANEHSEELEEKTTALKDYYAAYAEIFAAFMDRVMAVRDAYTGNDPDCPVARAISDKIMTNDSYGLDDFCFDLKTSMEASSAAPGSLREKVRAAFLECLQASSANWLNVMARFHAYGQVPFVRKALEDGGLDMALLDRAYISLEDILAYAGIDLYKPLLFTDNFNAEYHTNQPVRNIDTYIPDIASHAGPDTVVDLYLVGYDDGNNQRKPVVSKFA